MKQIKRWVSVLLIGSTFLLSGCFNYTDINEVIFATAFIVDLDEANHPVIYLEAFHAYRSKENNSEQGKRLVLVSKGRTLMEAKRVLDTSTSFKINASQSKVLIFTERAAAYGLDEFIDFFTRWQDYVLRSYVVVYKGDVSELLHMELKQEEFIGLYFKDLMDNPIADSGVENVQLYQVRNQRAVNDNNFVISLITIDNCLDEQVIKMYSGAVFIEDKMVDILKPNELQGFNLLNGGLSTGIIVIPHPQHGGRFISVEILDHKLKTDISFDGEEILLKKQITVKGTIADTQKSLDLQGGDFVETLNKVVEHTIQEECQKVFGVYKEKGYDIFQIKALMKQNYPKTQIENPIEMTNLEVKAHVTIESSSNTENFQ